jgi:pimeloyl-ACP methyl ester carboxylesterase
MPWIEVGGTDIYYQEEGSGQALVFLHGNSSCGEAWFQQFAAFRDRFRVIAYDSVNHGHSSNSPRGEEEPDRADELQAFLEAMGIERPVLAGNSMGGDTILRWAARHPDAAAALIPSGMGIMDGNTPALSTAPLSPDVLFLPVGDSLTEGFKQREPRMFERYLRIRSTATRLEAMRHPRPRGRTLAERATLGERVGAIRSPMSIIVGGLDRLQPACERLHALVPGSEYHAIAGAPHNVYYEAAAEYNANVSTFLDRVLQPAAAGSRGGKA